MIHVLNGVLCNTSVDMVRRIIAYPCSLNANKLFYTLFYFIFVRDSFDKTPVFLFQHQQGAE